MDKNSREYEVCLCYHITRGDVEDFLKETGIRDLKTLCQEMPVGDKCGGQRGSGRDHRSPEKNRKQLIFLLRPHTVCVRIRSR